MLHLLTVPPTNIILQRLSILGDMWKSLFSEISLKNESCHFQKTNQAVLAIWWKIQATWLDVLCLFKDTIGK